MGVAMSTVTTTAGLDSTHTVYGKPAASWSAIFAGAFVAVSTTIIFLALGSGLGFASISPWSDKGVSATTFTVTAAIWLIATQWVSSGLGGYIAGRLRSRWIGTHAHEVFFRDTAHGLVTWSLATVLIAGIAATGVVSAISGGVRAATQVAAAGIHGAADAATSQADSYSVERLFRGTQPQAGGDPREEATHIIANAALSGNLSDADRQYLISIVANQTGVAPEEAQKRVDEFVARAADAETKAKAAADAARKSAAQAAIYTAISLLIGAFIASVAAAVGGRLRDEHV